MKRMFRWESKLAMAISDKFSSIVSWYEMNNYQYLLLRGKFNLIKVAIKEINLANIDKK